MVIFYHKLLKILQKTSAGFAQHRRLSGCPRINLHCKCNKNKSDNNLKYADKIYDFHDLTSSVIMILIDISLQNYPLLQKIL